MKGKLIKFTAGIFPQLVIVSLNQTNMGFENSLREIFPAKKSDLLDLLSDNNIMLLDDVKHKYGTTIPLPHEVAVLIRLNHKPSTSVEQGLLAHEIFHAADAIAKDSGVEYTEFNETIAHIIGYLTERIYKKLNE